MLTESMLTAVYTSRMPLPSLGDGISAMLTAVYNLRSRAFSSGEKRGT
jgi:hypothetical protein